jgi:tetratricopeptide (TPR) repeat protein
LPGHSFARPPRALPLLIAAVLASTAAPALARSSFVQPAQPLETADSLEGNYLAAYIAVAAKDTAAAAVYFREALKNDPRNPELLERAFISFLADGSMGEAFRLAERVVARDPNSALANLALGVRSLKARQFAQGRTYFVKSSRGRGTDLTATLLTAWAQAGAGEGRKALETVDRLRSERAYTTFREYHAGLIAEVIGNPGEAERRLKLAYENERNTLRIVDAYARLEARRGRPDAAIAAYTAFDGLLPRHPLVRAALEHVKAGRTPAPMVATAQEGAAEVLYGLGAAGNSPGEELPAIVYLRLALHLAPDHPLALITLSDIYERLKRYDRAIEILERVPETSPLRGSAEIQIGLNLEQMNRGDEAIQHLEALLKSRPDDLEAIVSLGNVLRSRKRYAEAAEVYTRAVEKIGTPDRSHWTLFYFRGSAYERAKDWPKAEADLKLAIELVPETQPNGRAQALNYLGYSWVDMGMHVEEAFKLLRRAVELSPRDGMIIDSLGWAYYRMGRFEDAVRELEKAVELKPGDPVINDHLGDAYWKVGRHLEARFQWQHAKDANPEPEDLVKILRKLERGLEDEKPTTAETAEPVARRDGG